MGTPVLNKTQLKKALSAKKKLKKATIKNVLATPYSRYWPALNTEDACSLSNVLAEHLTRLNPVRVNVPWSELKNIPRQERKEARLKYITLQTGHCQTSKKSEAVFGVNETTKSLENNTASSIMISGDVNPQTMVKHIVDLAVLKKIPVLIVPNLKEILREKTGISSSAVALKNVFMDSQYWAIDQKIKEISLNYPIPIDTIHSQKNVSDEELTTPCSSMDIDENTSKNEQSRNVYLYRKSRTKRVFVPELSQNRGISNPFNAFEVDSSGFLAFNDSSANKKLEDDKRKQNSLVKSKVKVSYKSLIIKRVRNNKDRDKRKIDMLKKGK